METNKVIETTFVKQYQLQHLHPLERKILRQSLLRHTAMALLEIIQRAPKSVKCNTHHTIIVDADVMREIDSLLKENGNA